MSTAHTAKVQKNNEIAERRRRVARFMASAVPQYQMAEQLGVSGATISSDVDAVKAMWRQSASKDYGELVAERKARLDAIEEQLMPKVMSGIRDGEYWALDRWIKLDERYTRLLGLDAPQRIEVTARLEVVAQAMIRVIASFGIDAEEVRPRLASELRALDAISENVSTR